MKGEDGVGVGEGSEGPREEVSLHPGLGGVRGPLPWAVPTIFSEIGKPNVFVPTELVFWRKETEEGGQELMGIGVAVAKISFK